MRKVKGNLKVRQGRDTADKLLAIAVKAFSKQGYTSTGTEQIIAAAGLTKGALYHHYASKKALFEAAYRAAEEEVARRILSACANISDPWEQLLAGCFAYLDACSDPGLQRILRVDGPAVLGLERWAEIDREFGLDRLMPSLESMADAGIIKVPSVEAFACQLTGAMNESTFWIVQHTRPDVALRESKEMLVALLQSVRNQ